MSRKKSHAGEPDVEEVGEQGEDSQGGDSLVHGAALGGDDSDSTPEPDLMQQADEQTDLQETGAQDAEPSRPLEAPPANAAIVHSLLDPRLPPVGTVIERQYKAYRLKVLVLADGFEFAGEHYSSISKVAQAITGAKAINGYSFFRLGAAPGGKKTQKGISDSQRLEKRAAKIQRLIGQLKAAMAEGLEIVEEAPASAPGAGTPEHGPKGGDDVV